MEILHIAVVAAFLAGLIAGNLLERLQRFVQLQQARRERDRAMDQLIVRAGGLPITEVTRQETEEVRRQQAAEDDESEFWLKETPPR